MPGNHLFYINHARAAREADHGEEREGARQAEGWSKVDKRNSSRIHTRGYAYAIGVVLV